jgi:hypothetical protein
MLLVKEEEEEKRTGREIPALLSLAGTVSI